MLIGITYNPNIDLFYSGSNQTSLLLIELFSKLGYNITLVDYTNSDIKWWDSYPNNDLIKTANLYQTSGLDFLIDIDGFVNPDTRKKAAKKSIVFLRKFLQFTELDNSVYPEKPYKPRSFEGVSEIWCWDILNPVETLDSIQTIFPCPIRRVPFIWSSIVVSNYMSETTPLNYYSNNKWTIHIAEKNNDNTSSSILPLVAVRELFLKNIVNATYICHNMDNIKDNRFFKENVLNNIEADKLPIEISSNTQHFYDWLHTENILLAHSRFVPLRIGLINAIWLGLPVIHNNPILRDLHSSLNTLFYNSNEISGICQAIKMFTQNPEIYYENIDDIRKEILSKWSIESNLDIWKQICNSTFNMDIESKQIDTKKEITIAFSDMWPGFNYDTNFIIDSLQHECIKCNLNINIKGVIYDDSLYNISLLIFGPFGQNWKHVSNSIPKVFFSAENWANPDDSNIKLYITSSRSEDDTHIRIPTWFTFIDWYNNSITLPENCTDNPIRLPVHFAMKSHSCGFKDRNKFCGFVVSNPISNFRNDTFIAVNNYKKVNSGGALYNNIGEQLSLKYPGGGCGDISKYHFFSQHKFSISFENSQAHGYITEKVLHAKMAGCIPIYWGDIDTDSDFAPDSFINVSNITNTDKIVNIIKELENMPDKCIQLAKTPILNQEKYNKALDMISSMSRKLLTLCGVYKPVVNQDFKQDSINLKKIAKTFVINLDTRKDRWENLMKAEPYLKDNVTRISAVNGRTLEMSPFIYNLFNKNKFQWKKSIMGCILSHVNTWSKILNEEGEYFLVLEDDVRFNYGWYNSWSKYSDNIPEDAELLYLGGVLPTNKKALPSVLEPVNEYWATIKPNNLFSSNPSQIFHFCTYSYIITKKGAKKLMEYLLYSDTKAFVECDHLLGHPLIDLKKYIANPLLSYCFQDNDPIYQNSQFNDLQRKDKFDSDICNNNDCFTTASLIQYIYNGTHGNKLQLYYYGPWIKSDIYEHNWIRSILPEYELKQLLLFDNIENNTWFIVQRPYVHIMNSIFTQLAAKNINFKVLHLSDEFEKDDISFYKLENCKGVIRNYWRSDVPKLPHILTIPLGYHYKCNNDNNKSFLDRKLVWSFHGTNWFNRKELLENIINLVPYHCHFTPDWNHSTMTNEHDYLSYISNSKFCPILRGNNVETFRFYECLESGTIPIYVRCDNDSEFWKVISNKLSLINLESWDMAFNMMYYLLNNPEDAEKYRIAILEQWSIWKTEIKSDCSKLV